MRFLLAAVVLVWTYYALQQKLPLTGDELYHSHLFWKMGHGERPFLDFYSNHLPYYFQLLGSLIDTSSPEFVYTLRAVSIALAVGYALMVRPALWPYLLMFLIFGRAVEIRPDSIGLLLFNIGWVLLIRRGKRSTVAAALLAACSIFFSARGTLMMVPFGPLCLFLDRKRPWPLVIAGLAFAAALAAIVVADPEQARLIWQSVYLDAGQYRGFPLIDRFVWPERAILVILIAAALLNSLRSRNLVVAVAASAQIVLIVIDPLGYEYVYCWSLVPVLLGLPGSDRTKTWIAGGFAALIASAAAAYPIVKGRPAHAGSFLKLDFERRVRPGGKPVGNLIGQLYDRHDLWNQVAVRQELCRRDLGPVLTYFAYQPICLRDAQYYWSEARWPQGFDAMHPRLIIWGRIDPAFPDKYPSTVRDLERHDGFAIDAKARNEIGVVAR